MPVYTFSDLKSELGRYVDGGSCSPTTQGKRINEAVSRIMDMGNYECFKKIIRISVCNRSFPLPYNVEKLVRCAIDGTPSRIFGTAYQFLSSGVGDLDYQWGATSGFQDIADRGESPVMFDIPMNFTLDGTEYTPEGMRLLAVSTEAADDALDLTISGFKYNGEEVVDESVSIVRWSGGAEGTLQGTWDKQLTLSTSTFKDLYNVVKPVTSGYVCLYAVDQATNYMSFLSKMHSSQTICRFRRYNVTNHNVGVRASVLAQVQLRAVPMVLDTEVCPVESLGAIRCMLMSLREEAAGNLAGSVAFAEQSKKLMENRESTKTMTDGTPMIYNVDHRTSLGRTLNGKILI